MSTPTVNPTRQQLEELDALLQRMLSLPLNQLEGDAGGVPPPPPPVRPVPPPPHVGYSTSPAPMSAVSPPAPSPRPLATPAPPPRPVIAAPRPTPPPMPPRREPAPGDHTWNVPLPPSGGVSVYGSWPTGYEAMASSPRPVAPPPTPPPPPSNLRVTTIPSPDEANQARDATPPMERLRVEAPVAPSAPAEMAFGVNRPTPPASEPVPPHLWPLAAVDWIIGKPASLFGAPGRWLGQGGGKSVIGWAGILLCAGAVVWGVMDYMGWAW